MKSEGNPFTSGLSWKQSARFERASTSSLAYANTGARGAPMSATNLTPSNRSDLSEPCRSYQSSGPRPLGLEQTDLGLPQKTSEHTLSTLVGPWPCTSPGSQIARSHLLADGACYDLWYAFNKISHPSARASPFT